MAEPAGAGQAQHAQQPFRSAAAAQPERQVEQPQRQRAEAGSPVHDKPERNHAQNRERRAHGRRIIETPVVVRVVGTLDQDFRAIFQCEGVDAVGGRRFIGLHAALLACQYAVEKDAPGAEQLRHIERERDIRPRVFQHQPVGCRSVWCAERFGKVRILPGIHGAIRFPPGREILRREQLAGVVFPAVHEKGRRFRVLLQESEARFRGERPRVLVVTAEQPDPKDQEGGKKNGGECRKGKPFQKITSQGE